MATRQHLCVLFRIGSVGTKSESSPNAVSYLPNLSLVLLIHRIVGERRDAIIFVVTILDKNLRNTSSVRFALLLLTKDIERNTRQAIASKKDQEPVRASPGFLRLVDELHRELNLSRGI
jgi:hypothetical protein